MRHTEIKAIPYYMADSPRVSIIIPAFNAASVIAETLVSVMNQTFTDFEVLIVDDGSNDNTVDVAKTFCVADARFQLITSNHAGLSATRNIGIKQSRGEWIAFVDADDIWLPEKLARQMETVGERSEVDLSFTNYHFWDGTHVLRTRTFYEGMSAKNEILPRLIERCTYLVSAVIVRADLFKRVGGFDVTLPCCEDWDLWLRMAESGMTVAGIETPLVHYRRWPGNMTKNRLAMSEYKVVVLERNARASRHPSVRADYLRSIANARARLELVRACTYLRSQPDSVRASVWRAWRLYPSETKWLGWFLLLLWPKALGGHKAEGIVHRKLRRRYDSLAST